MRKTFIKTLIEVAENDENLYLLTGDLGFNVLEPFKEKFPDRFINAGVGEANMVGVATGLALSGKKVFVYSISPFVTFRSLDQARLASYMNLHIIIVGVGRGEEYHNAGISHYNYGIDQVMSALPLIILKPETKESVISDVITVCQKKDTYYLSLSIK